LLGVTVPSKLGHGTSGADHKRVEDRQTLDLGYVHAKIAFPKREEDETGSIYLIEASAACPDT